MVLEFLQFLADQHRAISTIKGYITAISNRHAWIDGARLGSHPLLTRWRKGLDNLLGVPRTLVPPWSLELVLAALAKAPFEPLNTISLKLLTWKTVFLLAISSARRASELHALRIDEPYMSWNASGVTLFPDLAFLPKVASKFACSQPICVPALQEESDPRLRNLCVRRVLKYYVERTRPVRGGDTHQLFVAYGRSQRGHPVTTKRVSQWLKLTIVYAYQTRSIPAPSGVKGHQVRKQAVSMAELSGVSPQAICEAATWSSTCTFAKFYRLNVLEQARSSFGRRVLQVACPAASESAPTPGSSTGDSSSRGSLRRFKIPKKKQ